MARRRLVYEGKAKILYEGPEPDTLIQYFKDEATAFNAQKKATIEGKGVLNNRLSEHFMTGLNAVGVPTHFIRRLNMREQLIRMVEMIPLEVVVRNYAAGLAVQAARHPRGPAAAAADHRVLLQGRRAGRPDGLRGAYHRLQLGEPAGHRRHDRAGAAGERLPLAACSSASASGSIDFKIEIGRVYDGDFQRLIVADEISPDSCRLWDIETGRKLDKDVFRQDLGDLSDAYTEVARRLGVMPRTNGRTHAGPKLVN